MRTKLDHYCRQLSACLDPMLPPLDRACALVDAATQGTPGRELLPTLAAARHDLRALGDKVRGQQAYVLIFGPLKSGKSTLMNAISAAYVSEVSSLPAYPCLVFVGAGERREFAVTRYDGGTTSYADAAALARGIGEAHTALAEALRSAEQRQQPFDPQQHLPAAIRRVDVRLPGGDLPEQGAVLVDTPGLYTRMRFGYDRLTRDFRDAAACAVFVVKSDTLFLEQVFAEFEQLLDLFSRVFLVVNVDSSKRDVGPDGTLVPSLEQADPAALLRAFRDLAMPGPLHRAAAEGRLQLFPVDLLRAASAVLQRREPPADFTAFAGDLRTFLGSDEYLASFRRDSLRRAERLAGEVRAALTNGSLQTLGERIDELQAQLEFTQAEIDLLGRAIERDLTPAFARAERAVADELERTARDEGQKLLRTLGASIDTWFLSGHALQWLIHDHWQPLLTDYRSEVERSGRRAVEQLASQSDGGLDLPAAFADLCERRDIDVRRLRSQAFAEHGAPAGGSLSIPVDVAAIPLRRGVLDVVTFRSLDAVRRRLFGPAERPDQKITAKDKAARLGEPGRLHLHQCVVQRRATLAPTVVGALQQHFGKDLRAATIARLRQVLSEQVPPLQAAEARLQRELARLRALHEPLVDLLRATDALLRGLPELASAFAAPRGGTDASRTIVLEPMPPREGLHAPAEPG